MDESTARERLDPPAMVATSAEGVAEAVVYAATVPLSPAAKRRLRVPVEGLVAVRLIHTTYERDTSIV
jgi:hypothetical protein